MRWRFIDPQNKTERQYQKQMLARTGSRLFLFLLIVRFMAATPCFAQENRQSLRPLNSVQQSGNDPCALVKIERMNGGVKSWSPDHSKYLVNEPDKNHTYQVYVVTPGISDERVCITCTTKGNGPLPDRDKMQAHWHPSGNWIVFTGEKAHYGLRWLPRTIRQGFLECGVWMDLYATTPDGAQVYKLQDGNGFTGPAFTPDGSKAVWAQAIGNVSKTNPFGKWALKMAVFSDRDGVPRLQDVHDITPPGTNWVEPGNFSANGKDLLLTADTGLQNAQWQDQFILDINTGHLTNLTRSPKVWDEHGLFSPDGRKIVFMSSYPYRNEPDTWKTLKLKTEFMLMNSDGSDLRQLTHFQVPGYPESTPRPPGSTAAVAVFNDSGTELVATQLLSGKRFPNYDTWKITFCGRCGNALDSHN